jgi:succinate dehydrogenase/fumarate reductase-like Fe-S protein
MDADVGKPVRRDDVIPLQVLAQDRTYRSRAVMPERSVEEVLGEGNYVQIEEGLTDTMAHDEARRCLRCDVCIGCGLCMAACSEMGHAFRSLYRLRRVHPCLPDGRDPLRGSRRHATHGHHWNRREGAAAAHLQRMRSADADGRAP